MATTPGDEERAAKEALDWLIRLREDPDDAAVRARFAAWLGDSDAHARAWREAGRTWDLAGDALALQVEHPSVRPGAQVAPARPAIPRRRVIGVATAALAACLIFFLLPSLLLRLQADYVTGAGETMLVRLPDGSAMHLGADSAAQVAHDGARRDVRLLAGEAFFEVVPDAGRPFTVAAGDLTATDVGTAFDVRLAAGGAAVAVGEGIVDVSYAKATPPLEERLRAGDWVEIGWQDSAITRGTIAPEQVAAWRSGRLVVKDRAIGEVVADLRRYHRGAIILADDALAQRRVTGVYDLGKPIEALRAVVFPYDAAVHELTPYLVVISSR
jgi:transmembrane sensor